jgi:Phage Tail Collar Domain
MHRNPDHSVLQNEGETVKLPRLIGRAVRYRHIRTVAEIAGALILLSGTAAVAASAATASSHPSPTIRGCVSTKTGALTVLLKAGASCRRGTKALSWNTALFGAKTNQAAAGTAGAQCTLGEVILTAGTTATAETAPADGQILKISSFTALYSLLGTKYGGNGKTTFALPNLRNAAPDGLTYSICEFGIFP